MKLSQPPAPSASHDVHVAWSLSALAAVEAEVRRLATPGLNVTVAWTVAVDGRAWSVGAYFCLGCTQLHHELGRQERPGGRWSFTDAI